MGQETAKYDCFIEAVAAEIDRRSLIAPGEGVVVGVSGGADSVALLAALRALAGEAGRGYVITVAHLNHLIRPDADDDERFVRELAERWGLACIAEQRDVPAEADTTGGGIEQTARRLRYEFLQSAAERAGASCVAVGHHADDNAETVLYRIVRGTHLRGLAGMPSVRPLGGSAVRLVRPLLSVTREQVEAYCRRAGLSWRTDSTNADTGYRRNFIRHEMLGLLRERLNPRADDALLRLAHAAGQVDAYLSGKARELLRDIQQPTEGGFALDVKVLSQADTVIRTQAIRTVLEEMDAPMRSVGAERLDELASLAGQQAAGQSPSAICLPGGIVVRRDGERLLITTPPQPVAGLDEFSSVPLRCPGETPLGERCVISCRIERFDAEAFASHCRRHDEGLELLDADMLRGGLTGRRRRDGDVFVPLGAPGRQSVSDFLTNSKLPRRRRERVVCICDELGIVYLAPLRIDDRVKVTGETKRMLRIAVSAAPGGLDPPPAGR